MNTIRTRLWLPLTLAALSLGAPGMAAPPAANETPAATGSILILNTGDAYVPGYRITVGPNGELTSASFPRNGGPTIRRRDQMTPANHQRLLADLAKAAPVNALPIGKAAPAGRRRRRVPPPPPAQACGAQVFVIYQKRESPNLRIAASGTGKILYQDIKQIMQVLRMPTPNVP